MKAKRLILLAAHDDGAGAHTTMCRVRRGLESALVRARLRDHYFFLYLNSTAFGKTFAVSQWHGGSAKEWEVLDGSFNSKKHRLSSRGAWQRTENILHFEKANDGSLDVPRTRAALKQAIGGFEDWGFQIRDVDPTAVALCIEMGVPQLSHWSSRRGIPSVAVGDTFWSRTLMYSLEGAGEYDRHMENIIHELAERERTTKEAWLLPLLAPRVYADFLAQMRVPYHFLPGFFGERPSSAVVKRTKKGLKIRDGNSLVVLAAGQTGVWRLIYQSLAETLMQRPSSKVTFLYPEADKLSIVEGGKKRQIHDPPSLTPIFANADLGITRGGVTTIEFIAAKIPFVIVQEPNHWLSQKQQAAAIEEGICHASSLSFFQDPKVAIELIEGYLNAHNENREFRIRHGWYDFEVEDKLGAHLVERFLH